MPKPERYTEALLFQCEPVTAGQDRVTAPDTESEAITAGWLFMKICAKPNLPTRNTNALGWGKPDGLGGAGIASAMLMYTTPDRVMASVVSPVKGIMTARASLLVGDCLTHTYTHNDSHDETRRTTGSKRQRNDIKNNKQTNKGGGGAR